MNVIYNLSDADCKEAVFSCNKPMVVRSDCLTAYVGVDRTGRHSTVLVLAGEQNVLLHEGDAPMFVSASPAPDRPWVFRIKSVEPLLVQAQFTCASIEATEVYVGDDHGNVPFIAVSLFGHEGLYLFRLPEPDVEAWTAHSFSPLHCTVRERELAAAGTGDPVLDELLGFLKAK